MRKKRNVEKALAKIKPDTPGWRLAKRRLEMGLSADELAEKSGISRPHISGMENNKEVASRAAWDAMAVSLESNVPYLLYAIGQPGPLIAVNGVQEDGDLTKERLKREVIEVLDWLGPVGYQWLHDLLISGKNTLTEMARKLNDVAIQPDAHRPSPRKNPS